MFGVTKLLAAGALVAGLLLPAPAMAAFEALTRVDLNLRIGPGTTYGVIDVIPAGYPVIVIGCLEEYYWCDVDFDGLRGWVAGRYLVQPGTAVYLPQWAPAIGLPIVSFSFNIYHDRHYRGRPWHRQRAGHWRGHRQVQRTRQRPQATEQRRQRPQATQPRRQRPQATEQRRRSPQATEQRRRSPQATEQRRQRPQATEQRRQSPQATEQRRQQATGQRQERPRALQQRRGSEDEERRPRRRGRN
jgi:uncharacterized protein YraI